MEGKGLFQRNDLGSFVVWTERDLESLIWYTFEVWIFLESLFISELLKPYVKATCLETIGIKYLYNFWKIHSLSKFQGLVSITITITIYIYLRQNHPFLLSIPRFLKIFLNSFELLLLLFFSVSPTNLTISKLAEKTK